MIIIVEGMDNAGKTTLCQFLAKQLRAVYIKVERPRRAVDLLAYQHILETANAYSGMVVTDRHVAISEPIYGPICRGKHDLKQEEIDLCANRFQALIYCRPPLALIMKTIAERPQMSGVEEHTEQLVEAYDIWWRQQLRARQKHAGNESLFLYHYDFTEELPRMGEDIRRDLVDMLNHHAKVNNI